MSPNVSASLKPVLFVLTSHGVKGSTDQPTGYYLGEVTHPLAELEAAGIAVEFASIQGGEPPVDGLEVEDALNARYWNDAGFRAAVRDTQALDAADASRYSAIFFAGGHGAMWDFPVSDAVRRVTREIFEAGGAVAAVCHGPAALVNVTLSDGAYLVAGKRVSAFTDEEEAAVGLSDVVPFLLASTLRERGALHQPAPNWSRQVVVDGRLITGQNPQSAGAVGAALRELLLTRAAV
ncbi:type 1 glutamine amidotransferase domain-containing protein [Lysobacter gummosus]|uniref:Type 1 glutamine amidotransferase domain-containing protein n=1 Tax=Lysobacter gummosus TaxID=262324 RepID=A0ABY3XHE1_9GAMM|nr:type 1 glutamine amidotransferase domain-containing protein [Lysobacter gummosus]UNP31032.1 type 1 glutamine amidotransferase domain-containing protein [Lysobacter gummosus]